MMIFIQRKFIFDYIIKTPYKDNTILINILINDFNFK
jgi:hypothetical protein